MSVRGERAKKPSRSRVLTYDQALAAARRLFVKESTVDMRNLAEALSVGRATLYRVVGSRDRLLGDVIWSLAEQTFAMAVSETKATGVERIIQTAYRFNSYVVPFEPLRNFVRSEPAAAVRVLFTPAGAVHERSVERWKELITQAQETGELTLPFDVESFAYVFVRIGESILYSDLLADREPDIELAAMVQRALFVAQDDSR